MSLGVCLLVLLFVLAGTGLYIFLWNRGAEPEIKLDARAARREYLRNLFFATLICFLNRILPFLLGPREHP